jgi:hypothetical protein
VISGATDADAQPQACSEARPPPRARTHRRLPQEGCTASRAAVTIAPHLDGVMTPMPDNFFASVRDQVFAFFTQLPDRVSVWEWIKNNPQATIALGTLLVAVLAFLVALRTAWAQPKHNRLSVRPLADIAFGNYETDLFVRLVNNGTGPMVIKSITVIGAANPSEPLIKAMPDLPPDDLVTLTYFASDPTGRSIRAGGGGLRLLQLRYKGDKEFIKNRFAPSRDKIRAALGPLTLRIKYTDIYKKGFVTKRSLGYFASELPNRSPPPSDAR